MPAAGDGREKSLGIAAGPLNETGEEMKLRIALAACGLMIAGASWADEKADPAATPAAASVTYGWKREVTASLNLNQASFDNWQGGGTNFVSWQGELNAKLENDTAADNWSNSLKMEYGMTFVDGQGTRKSADGINLESVYSWKTWAQVNPFVSLAAKTQFDIGFNYSTGTPVPISGFLDPGYFTETAGLKYIPDTVFNTRLGFAAKETIAHQYESIYTVNPDTGAVETELTDLGISSVSELNLKLSSNSNFDSKLDMFWNGRAIDRTVVEWDNLLTLSLNKIISVNMEDDFRYDKIIYNGWQIKETLGLGFAFSLL